MIVEIDGNDGVGKTTCINILKQHFGDDIEFKDRGALTLATDSDEFNKEKGVCYILLDCSVEECQNRILKRGDSITEKYHTIEDLTYYRERFLKIASKNNIAIFDTTLNLPINDIINYIKGFKDGYCSRN